MSSLQTRLGLLITQLGTDYKNRLQLGTTSTTAMAGNKTAANIGGANFSGGVTAVVQLTAAAYAALGTKSSTTLYIVVG